MRSRAHPGLSSRQQPASEQEPALVKAIAPSPFSPVLIKERERQMTSHRRSAVLACIAALAAGALLGVPASSSADSCPNADIRAAQKSTHLPDCRAYELVSRADTNNNNAMSLTKPSLDGNRVIYSILGGASGTPSGGYTSLRATRTSTGWTSDVLSPPYADQPATSYVRQATSPDLMRSLWAVAQGTGGGTPSVSWARLDANGGQSLLATFFDVNVVPRRAATSNELDHVFTIVPQQHDPSHQPGTANIYDFGSGTPSLTSRMPTSGNAPTCGLPSAGFVTGGWTVANHWVSTDGSRVIFGTAGDDAPDCDDPVNLYQRDLVIAQTDLISGPPLPGDPDFGVQEFLQGAADGAWAIYRTATSIDTADDVDGDSSDLDIYRWIASTGVNDCLTCVVPNAAVRSGQGSRATAEDGSRVYFYSLRQLDDAPTAGTNGAPNLYVWQAGQIEFVARIDSFALSNDPVVGGDVTGDGRFLLFSSSRPELNAPEIGDNGGHSQLYRYDAVADALTCVSCPTQGAATADVPTYLSASPSDTIPHTGYHVMSDDGSVVYFMTAEALVAHDVNQRLDVYRWKDGSAALITDGVSQRPTDADPALITTTPDGRDVLFLDVVRLTPEAKSAALKIYDARVGGGFPGPPSPSPACVGDACQGAPLLSPLASLPASTTFNGAGNVTTEGRASFALRSLSRAQRARIAHDGRGTLRVRVSRAGRLSFVARARIAHRRTVVARGSTHVEGRGTGRLAFRLSSSARRQLARARTLRVTVNVRFSGTGRSKALTLRLSARDGSRR
jgi:hypothetical protein